MEQSKKQVPPYPSYYGSYPINPNLIRRYQPQIPKTHRGISSCASIHPINTTLKLDYWQLLSPALFGAAGALFLSRFSCEKSELVQQRLTIESPVPKASCGWLRRGALSHNEPFSGQRESTPPQAEYGVSIPLEDVGVSRKNNSSECFGGTFLKLAIVGYSASASVAVSFAIGKVLKDSRPPYDHLLLPIGGAVVSIILLFGANYLLLYRFSPSSFKGEVGDNFLTQLFSFLYLSTTTIATAGLGDIMPNGVTARALIAIEIAFNLFTMATAIQLLLAQKNQ